MKGTGAELVDGHSMTLEWCPCGLLWHEEPFGRACRNCGSTERLSLREWQARSERYKDFATYNED